MYADLDFEALRNVEPLLPGRQVLLGSMMTGMDSCRGAEWGMCNHAIPNAWMASVRGHPFWLFALHQIIKAAGEGNTTRHADASPLAGLYCPRARMCGILWLRGACPLPGKPVLPDIPTALAGGTTWSPSQGR